MKSLNKDNFLKKSVEILGEIYEILESAPEVKFEEFESEKTAFVIVDMINGFAKEGSLKSSRVEDLIPEISEMSKKCEKYNIKKIAFADCHTEESPEFGAYPVHCMKDSYESQVVDELKEIGGYKLIPKNSTNGFLEEEFQNWLKENKKVDTFIVTGDCTDICVQQFAITLKTWFNMKNIKVGIIVPISVVDTYDLGTHNGDLMNVMALYNMITNGVDVVKSIK